MKLIVCPECSDVIKLRVDEWRTCHCGKIGGKYIDRVNAVVTPGAVSLAIGNGSLFKAILQSYGSDDGKNREQWIEHGKVLAWLRSNEEPGNPHTKVLETENGSCRQLHHGRRSLFVRR